MGVDSEKWKRDILDETIVLGYPGVIFSFFWSYMIDLE